MDDDEELDIWWKRYTEEKLKDINPQSQHRPDIFGADRNEAIPIFGDDENTLSKHNN